VLDRAADAVRILEDLTERHRSRYFPPYYLGAGLEMLGRHGAAREAYLLSVERATEFVQRNPNHAHARSILAIALAGAGQTEAARRQIARALELSGGSPRIRYNAACVYARLGEPVRAVTELEQAIPHLPGYHAGWESRDPDLASLRNHPEFRRLQERLASRSIEGGA
ncbi:MAG: TPR end-of-group domain-containing protein, partial [Candidatus Eiseniibacteriota bacterium]